MSIVKAESKGKMNHREKHWHPIRWTDVEKTAARVKAGDVIHNPCYARDRRGLPISGAYRVAEMVHEALAKRGMKIDHPACVIGFVEPLNVTSNSSQLIRDKQRNGVFYEKDEG